VLFRNSFTVGQLRLIRELAIRELVVTGCVHRDWNNPEATVVEHIGDTVTVTSPGGFAEGVTVVNLLSHPSTSRNRFLVDLFATLRVAESRGIDMVTREMLRMGQLPPEIDQLDGLRVRASLSGSPHEPWLRWLQAIRVSRLISISLRLR
jgi:ATP-dependent DNA helicase RecG